jgi:hypothetical protein
VSGDTTDSSERQIQNVQRLAARLTEYVVLANDPAVPLSAADFWQQSSPHYRAVTRIVEQLVDRNAEAMHAYRALVEEPDTGRHEARLIRALAHVLPDALPDGGVADGKLSQTLGRADESVFIRHHLGTDYDPATPTVPLDEALSLPGLRGSMRPSGGTEALVVIGLRDRGDGQRVRNLLACVASLRDQSIDRVRMTVTVVETDDEPRWRHVVEPVADEYVFAAHGGPFNRSWAANLGVMNSAPTAPYVCVLDADVLVDRWFIERNVDRLREGTHDAHLPFEILIAMDEPASSRAIRQRCRQGDGDVPLSRVRAQLLRDVPGACLWARRDFYERLGGFDERYEGWGGEDDDFMARMQAAGEVLRFDDQFLHMAHPRPSMARPDGRPYNAHIPPMSWTSAHGFGRVAGPVGSGERTAGA